MHCVSWTGRHNYQPVYDEVPSGMHPNELLHLPYDTRSNLKPADARAFLVVRKYVQHVCLYCGDVVERPGAP